MKVKLLHNTPLEVADIAISKCYDKEPYKDVTKQQSRINRVANVSKHSSTIEHLVYSFDIEGISRAVLQELARHRIASYTVKSTRYTLKELVKASLNWEEYNGDADKFLVRTGNIDIDEQNLNTLRNLRDWVGIYPNDVVKYMLPEAYKTALVMTINARALQNFLALRTDSHALWEIQDLARAMYDVIPNEHRFLFEEVVKPES